MGEVADIRRGRKEPHFESGLILRHGPSSFTWTLTQPLLYWSQQYGIGMIKVHAGFITDMASVPRAFWAIFPPWGRYAAAAVVHDFLYAKRIYKRRMADVIFRDAMRALGTPEWQVLPIYWSVRLFGWIVWRRKGKGNGPAPRLHPNAA